VRSETLHYLAAGALGTTLSTSIVRFVSGCDEITDTLPSHLDGTGCLSSLALGLCAERPVGIGIITVPAAWSLPGDDWTGDSLRARAAEQHPKSRRLMCLADQLQHAEFSTSSG
jgi:hypothetical protein